MLHLLVHSPDDHNVWSWAGSQEAEASESPTWIQGPKDEIRDRMSSLHWLIPRMAAAARAEQTQSWEAKLLPGFPGLGLPSSTFTGCKQGAEWKVEQPECQLGTIWDALPLPWPNLLLF